MGFSLDTVLGALTSTAFTGAAVAATTLAFGAALDILLISLGLIKLICLNKIKKKIIQKVF